MLSGKGGLPCFNTVISFVVISRADHQILTRRDEWLQGQSRESGLLSRNIVDIIRIARDMNDHHHKCVRHGLHRYKFWFRSF